MIMTVPALLNLTSVNFFESEKGFKDGIISLKIQCFYTKQFRDQYLVRESQFGNRLINLGVWNIMNFLFVKIVLSLRRKNYLLSKEKK